MPSKPKRRGPSPRKLSAEERTEFLALLRSGFGQHMALRQIRVGWQRFAFTRKRDRAFAREIREAEAFRREQLVSLRYAQALGGDAQALQFLIGREDAAQRFRQARADARRRDRALRDDAIQAAVIAWLRANARGEDRSIVALVRAVLEMQAGEAGGTVAETIVAGWVSAAFRGSMPAARELLGTIAPKKGQPQLEGPGRSPMAAFLEQLGKVYGDPEPTGDP